MTHNIMGSLWLWDPCVPWACFVHVRACMLAVALPMMIMKIVVTTRFKHWVIMTGLGVAVCITVTLNITSMYQMWANPFEVSHSSFVKGKCVYARFCLSLFGHTVHPDYVQSYSSRPVHLLVTVESLIVTLHQSSNCSFRVTFSLFIWALLSKLMTWPSFSMVTCHWLTTAQR